MSADSAVPENANDGCVGPTSSAAGTASACAGCPNQADCSSGKFAKPDPAVSEVADRMAEIKHKILILSGKGGVGKSTFSSQLTWLLSHTGKDVGILDIDICGPSVPRMMGVENEEVHRNNAGWSPVYAEDNVAVMSVGFMLSKKEDAIIWRGPRKNGLIKQFLTEVEWGPMDFLIVDAPPGTSDEHISLAQYMKQSSVDGAVLLTTPQEVSLLDVRKEVTFCKKTGIPILGVVENMSGFVCPCCKEKSDVFPAENGGAAKMCAEMKVPFLGSIPLDPRLLRCCEKGQSFFAENSDTPCAQAFRKVVDNILNSTPHLAQTAAGLKFDIPSEQSGAEQSGKGMEEE